MDDDLARELLEELRTLRAEVAALKAAPPARPVENGHAVPAGYHLTGADLASRYNAEFLTPMLAAGVDPNKRPDLHNIFADIPAD